MKFFEPCKQSKTNTLARFNHRINSFNISAFLKLKATILCATVVLSGCAMTEIGQTPVTEQNFERIDSACIKQIRTAQSLPLSNVAQHLSLANSALFCIGDIAYTPQHPDTKTAMQFNALAVMNYIKAGDMQAAQEAFIRFRQTFPQQDLMFADYSSFVDTASVLLAQQQMSAKQLTLLNINPKLRDELNRQRRWAAN